MQYEIDVDHGAPRVVRADRVAAHPRPLGCGVIRMTSATRMSRIGKRPIETSERSQEFSAVSRDFPASMFH
ncbi:hypothetical protein [Allosalinactinospora lopnorensis]|uniref:hypothetical protein n=1 Tax=Allosalinactinospora lopnorensis TaxID=1352348 RepID=UPI00138F0986|nr:hypothetical protein [Allosalinactinospora lopnorensis]